ncbi:hypothetical protein BDM02DRAFT_1056006 [Thelephora ganbajun]|uniref:Uncharacterized protein n=1 Tax=Thelephora ganbajun TaxID=370292 RepID=A0ACB6Z3T6_THEGA|nr:hypothetical protein BDM02DRAFT_1056006 [Thelephora ganbajun]
MAPQDEGLKELCDRIYFGTRLRHSPEPIFTLVIDTLRLFTNTPPDLMGESIALWGQFTAIPDHVSTAHKLWLGRISLQTLWRWRRLQDPTTFINFSPMDLVFKRFMADGDKTIAILSTNCYLIMAISLGLQIDIHDLYAPNNNDALQVAINLFHQRLQISIREMKADRLVLRWTLSALIYLDPFQIVDTRELVFLWIIEILNSEYPEDERYEMASRVVHLLEKHFDPNVSKDVPYAEPTWIPPLLGFLSLSERFYTTDVPPYPGLTTLRILSTSPVYADFDKTIIPVLTSTLLPTHPLQSCTLALKVFYTFMPGWFSSQMEDALDEDLDKFLQAVGNPFLFTPDISLQDGKPVGTVDYEPMMAAVVLIEFASSDLWRDHLRRLNFASYEEIVSTEEGRNTALRWMLGPAVNSRRDFLRTPTKITTAIRRLEELQCLNTAEVVISWAWTIGVINLVDHGAWSSIGNDTLRFYQTYGTGRLIALKRHVIDSNGTTEFHHLDFLCRNVGYKSLPCRVECSTSCHDPGRGHREASH